MQRGGYEHGQGSLPALYLYRIPVYLDDPLVFLSGLGLGGSGFQAP